MSSLYQRNGVWYYQTCEKGKIKQTSLKTRDKTLARQKQKKMDAQIELGLLRVSQGKVSLEEAFDSYLKKKAVVVKETTLRRYKGLIVNLKAFFQERKISLLNQLDKDLLADFVAHRQSQNASNKTIFEELLLLKGTYHCFEKGLNSLPADDWPKLKKVAKKPMTLNGYSAQELKRIFEFLNDEAHYPYLMMLAYTGCRRSELFELTKGAVNLTDNYIQITNLKTGTSPGNQFRYIEIHPALLPILKRACENKKATDRIFPRRGTGNWLVKSIKKACEKLNIQYRRLHGLRHTFISELLNQNVPLRVVMEIAGHKNFSTTLRYSHISQNELRGKIKKIDFG